MGRGFGIAGHRNFSGLLNGLRETLVHLGKAMSYFVGCNAVDDGIPEDAGLMGLESPLLTHSVRQSSLIRYDSVKL